MSVVVDMERLLCGELYRLKGKGVEEERKGGMYNCRHIPQGDAVRLLALGISVIVTRIGRAVRGIEALQNR